MRWGWIESVLKRRVHRLGLRKLESKFQATENVLLTIRIAVRSISAQDKFDEHDMELIDTRDLGD